MENNIDFQEFDLFLKGIQLCKEGKYDEAIKYIEEASCFFNDFPEVHAWLSYAYLKYAQQINDTTLYQQALTIAHHAKDLFRSSQEKHDLDGEIYNIKERPLYALAQFVIAVVNLELYNNRQTALRIYDELNNLTTERAQKLAKELHNIIFI